MTQTVRTSQAPGRSLSHHHISFSLSDKENKKKSTKEREVDSQFAIFIIHLSLSQPPFLSVFPISPAVIFSMPQTTAHLHHRSLSSTSLNHCKRRHPHAPRPAPLFGKATSKPHKSYSTSRAKSYGSAAADQDQEPDMATGFLQFW